jgi:hypothetical protein
MCIGWVFLRLALFYSPIPYLCCKYFVMPTVEQKTILADLQAHSPHATGAATASTGYAIAQRIGQDAAVVLEYLVKLKAEQLVVEVPQPLVTDGRANKWYLAR